MPTRTARTAWNGGLQDGSGQVELTSSKAGTYPVDFPKRASDSPEGQTSPEELIAAGHAACFAMSLANEVGQAGGTPHGIEVSAEVDLGPDEKAGGFILTEIRLTGTVEADGLDDDGFTKAIAAAEADGLDDDGFTKAIAAAEAGCPVSKALASVKVVVDVTRA